VNVLAVAASTPGLVIADCRQNLPEFASDNNGLATEGEIRFAHEVTTQLIN
jgi:hypothetical protein